MMMFKRYIKRLTLWTIGFLAVVLAVNVVIDPYTIFGMPRIEGLNARKPYAGDRGRVAKVYQVMAQKPNGLIIGNSRPEIGLDPHNACWPDAARPVYNLGIPGLGPYSQVRYAQHAMASRSPKLVMIGADFPDYLTNATSSNRAAWWPDRHAEPLPLLVNADNERRPGFVLDRLKDYLASSLSLDTFYHSIMTILAQGSPESETRTPLGMNDGPAIYIPIVRNEGASVLFAQKNREMMARLSKPGLKVFAPGTRWSPELEALEHLLDLADENGSRTIIVINPLHVDYLLTIDVNGLWPAFQDWKRALAELAARHDVELWDFAVVDEHSTQPVSSLKPKGESLTWFWEPAHYKKELGDLMLDNIFRGSCDAAAGSPAYGTRLTPGMMDDYLRRNEERMTRYKAEHPQEVRHLASLRAD